MIGIAKTALRHKKTTPWRRGVERRHFADKSLSRLPRPASTAFRLRGLGDVLGVLSLLEVGVLGNVVQQDRYVSGYSRKRNLPRLSVGYESLVDASQNVIRATSGNGSHVESLLEVASATLGLCLLLDRGTLMVDGCVSAHLGNAFRVELADVWAIGENVASKARPYALDLLESSRKIAHAFVALYGCVACGLKLCDLLVDLFEKLGDALLHVGVGIVLELIVDERPGFLVVLSCADGFFQSFVRFGTSLDEVKFLILEGCGVVADHLAVNGVSLLKTPLGLRVPACPPGVETHGTDILRETFVGKRLLVWTCCLEAHNRTELGCFRNQSGSAGLDVLDMFFLTVGIADVEPVLSDVHSDVHSGRNHDILSLSSSYRVFVTRMPLQPFRLLLMTKRRFPDSPAICEYLEGNEITAAARGTMAIAPWHSLRSGFDASAISETAEQEQREVYHKRDRQGGRGKEGKPDPPRIIRLIFSFVQLLRVSSWIRALESA